MPIPALTSDGWLPIGVHLCTLPEVRAVFTAGSEPNRRGRLVSALQDHLASATVRHYVEHILIDGSFVSRKMEPSDVDVVLGVRKGSFAAIATVGMQAAAIIEALEGRFVPAVDGHRAIHGFADEIGGPKYAHYFRYFQQSTRDKEPRFKGVLRVDL